jgi:hypothetical protein
MKAVLLERACAATTSPPAHTVAMDDDDKSQVARASGSASMESLNQAMRSSTNIDGVKRTPPHTIYYALA